MNKIEPITVQFKTFKLRELTIKKIFPKKIPKIFPKKNFQNQYP